MSRYISKVRRDKQSVAFHRRLPQRKASNVGQGLLEYSIILSSVGVALVTLMILLGSGVKDLFCPALIALNPDYSTSCIDALEEVEVPEGQPHSILAIAISSRSRGSLIVAARIPEDLIAGLSVAGYGDMQYLPGADAFVLEIPMDDPPERITIHSTVGAMITINVLSR